MLGKNKRKGFTLAELLIVVAIIAVLVAIAVPLFISGLKKAQDARDDANKRSVKAAAVVYILNAKPDNTNVYENGVFLDDYKVVADVTTDGKISITTIGKKTTSDTNESVVPAKEKDGWTITVFISSTDLSGLPSDTP